MGPVSRSSTPVPTDTLRQAEDDLCPICHEVLFHGRDVALAIAETLCEHYYHLNCISKWFYSRSLKNRVCCYCQQDALPLKVISGTADESNPFIQHEALEAAVEGMTERLDAMLATNSQLALTTFHDPVRAMKVTLLHVAAESGNYRMIKSLLANGANIHTALSDAGKYTGWTPMMSAAQEGHYKVVKCLLANGANIHAAVRHNGWTPLMSAAKSGHHKVVRYLLASGANVNAAQTSGVFSGWTALMSATRNGHYKVVRCLLANGANVNAAIRDAGINNGWTALMAAANNGHHKIVECLLANGADAGAQCQDTIALFYAAREKHWHVVKTLI